MEKWGRGAHEDGSLRVDGLIVVMCDYNDECLSRSPSDDLQSLLNVLPFNVFDTVQLFLNVRGQSAALRIFSQIGNQLDSV